MGSDDAPGIPHALADLIEREMRYWRVPGAALAIRDRGHLATQSFGVTSLETHQPVTPKTLFRIASMTKTFTATLVMILVDEGRFDLDTPVIQYTAVPLADDTARRTITLRHLLTHTPGFEGDDWRDTGQGDDALARYIAGFGALRQMVPPGEVWAYANTGYALAGSLVATVLGVPFEEAMRERVLKPLGLERTVLFPHEAIVYPVAIGHMATAEDLTIMRHYALPRGNAPAGNLISTVEDLMTYAAFHMGDGTVEGKRLLRRESLRAMQTPQVEAVGDTDAWGLGWGLRALGGTTVLEHGGDILGFHAWLCLMPADDFALAVMTNSSQGSALIRRVVDWALASYRGLRRAEPQQITLSTLQLAPYAGRYTWPVGRETDGTVIVQDGGLLITIKVVGAPAQAIPPIPLAPLGEDHFVVTAGQFRGERVRFLRHPDGSLRFLHLFGRLSTPEQAPAGYDEPSVCLG